MAGGRPSKYDNCLDFDAACELYFDEMAEKEIYPTVTGLALALGFCDRQSLYDYENKEEFSCIIKRARLRVENGYEQQLQRQSVTGAIFALKNMGWKDKQEREITNPDGSLTPPTKIEIVAG